MACEMREPVVQRRDEMAAVMEMLMTSSTGQPTSDRTRITREVATVPWAKRTILTIETPVVGC